MGDIEDIDKLVNEIAIKEGFIDYKINTTHGSMKGDGYIGIITCVTILDNQGSKRVNLVVKQSKSSGTIQVSDLFQREIYMYDTVFKFFRELELEKNLPLSSTVPKFHGSLVTEKYQFLILDNLKELGYELHERRIPMNDDHIRLVMSEYGRFHALSFALRDQNPNAFKDISGALDDHFTRNIKENNFIQNFVQLCVKAQKSLNPDTDGEVIKRYEVFLKTITAFFDELPAAVDEFAVALHGDCWTNNMLFKYGDSLNAAKPSNVCFLDFQVSRMNSPVLDLSYFLYTCSPKEIFNNLDHYLQLYYESFSTYLRKLGSDPEKMFPYSALKEHWRKYARYGLIFAVLVIHISLTEKDETVELADASESNVANVFDYEIGGFDKYKERIRPIIIHFVKNNFL